VSASRAERLLAAGLGRGAASRRGRAPATRYDPRVRSRPATLLLAALCSVGVARAEEAPAKSLPAWKKGVQEGVVSIDGKDERFVAWVPAGYSPKKPSAAVLLLHGNGGNAAGFLQNVKPYVGKSPLLLIALERCDNQQKAEGYAPKYLEALRTQFALADGRLFALGFSGGGFRLWDDVVAKAEEAAKFRGVVLVGSARQSFDPAEKPAAAPTVVLVGDPKDSNFTESGPAAEKALVERGYETVVLEHSSGHSMPPAEMKAVFAWIDAVVAGKKTTLATRRLGDGDAKKR
jgi:predicted esterase